MTQHFLIVLSTLLLLAGVVEEETFLVEEVLEDLELIFPDIH